MTRNTLDHLDIELVSKWLYTLHSSRTPSWVYTEWYIDLVNIYKLPFRCCLAADSISYQGTGQCGTRESHGDFTNLVAEFV
jgi:hypothetical protein